MQKMMFTVAATLLFVLSFATLAMAQSIDGTWEVKVVSPQGERVVPVTFKQTGETIAGKMGPYDVTGTLKGSDVTLKYTVKFQDNDLPITMTGKLNGDSMGGKADFGGFAEGDWSAKKSAGGAAAPAAAAGSSSGAAAGAGEWTVTFSTPNGDVATKMSLKQDGEKLSGDSKGDGPLAGPYPVAGTLKGDALELKFTIKFEGNDLPITMKGKVTGSEMKGSADYGGLAEGEFKGKKN